MDFTLSAWQMWLIVAVMLAIGEIFLTSGFFLLWFALGAGAATVAALLGMATYGQILVFLAASLVLIVLTRPLVKRFIHRDDDPAARTNLESLEGKKALVTEAIDNIAGAGQVLLQGETWSARTADGEPLPVGTRVIVIRVDGVKLVVKPNDLKPELPPS